MTIKSILKTACIFLQKDELLSVQSLDGIGTETDEQTKELSHLLRCLNLVLSEIATDYIPLLKTETVSSTDGKILLSSLSKDVLDIVKVENKFMLSEPYKLFPGSIETIPGEVKITYSYEPAKLESLTSEIENFSGKLTDRLVAYGVAMEYCFICGLHDDASIWEKRFKDGLLIAARKKSAIRLPKRRWI